jgi:hypothetical protein
LIWQGLLLPISRHVFLKQRTTFLFTFCIRVIKGCQMVISHDFFNHVENLEPHCPGCQTKVVFGLTTEYQEKAKTHVCKSCGHQF